MKQTVLVIALVCALLSGCGGSGQSAQSGGQPSPATMLGTWTGTAGGNSFSVAITSYTTDPQPNFMDFQGTYAWPGIQPGCAANGGISGTLCLPNGEACNGPTPSGTAAGQIYSSLCAQASFTGTVNESFSSWSGVISSCNTTCNQFDYVLTK